MPYNSYSSLALPDPPPLLEETLRRNSELFLQEKQEHSNNDAPLQHVSTNRSYIFPTSTNNEVIRPFIPPAVKWGAGHRGVDIELAEGSNVLAAGDGIVIYAGKLNDRPVISIEHSDGIRTTYEPVSPYVSKGDTVQAGDVIGTLNGGHCAHTSCLHWGAKRGKSDYMNPLLLLRERQIRLIE